MKQTSLEPVETIILDCDHILSYAGGDSEQLVRLCANFLRELPIHMGALRIAFKHGETFAAERALRLLDNCLVVLGSGAVSATMEALQSGLRCGNTRQVRREWVRIQELLQQIVPQVQRLMLEVTSPRSAVQ
jgi:hypothetical protein